jgi:hypothetical protein
MGMIADPVYVAGVERTGTSLMFALLASHPSLAMTRRTNLWTYFYDRFGDLASDQNLTACLDLMRSYKRLVVLQLDFEEIKREFVSDPDRSYARLFAIIESQHASRLGKLRWGDKSLHTERYTSQIVEAFPHARFIHMIRDPRDRYASVISRWKVRKGGAGASAAEWLESAELAATNQAAFPRNYQIIRYEDLSSQPEDTMRGVCDFIGEQYLPEILAMDGAARFRDAGANSSYGPLEVGSISTASIGKYREILDPAETLFMERKLGERMTAFAYEPSDGLNGGGDAFGTRLRESTKFHLWTLREQRKNRRGRRLPAYRIVDSS